MPTYTFMCERCKKSFEVVRPVAERAPAKVNPPSPERSRRSHTKLVNSLSFLFTGSAASKSTRVAPRGSRGSSVCAPSRCCAPWSWWRAT